MHAVAPSADWYLPAAHIEHVDLPAAAVMLPGAHLTWAVDPAGHAEPAGHGVQPFCAVPPSVARYEPAAHAEAAAAPAPQNELAGQLMHTAALLADWYVPAAQGVQTL